MLIKGFELNVWQIKNTDRRVLKLCMAYASIKKDGIYS